MSAKHLQRLRAQHLEKEAAEKQRTAPGATAEHSSDEDDSSGDQDEQPAKLQFNPFSLIQSDSDETAGSSGGSGDDSDSGRDAAHSTVSGAAAAAAAAAQARQQQAQHSSKHDPDQQPFKQQPGGFREKKQALKAVRAAEAAKASEAKLSAAQALLSSSGSGKRQVRLTSSAKPVWPPPCPQALRQPLMPSFDEGAARPWHHMRWSDAAAW